MDRKKPIDCRQGTLDLIGATQEVAADVAHVERGNAIPGIRVGTSAFTAAGWERSFYPAGTQPRDYLSYYATKFDTVEVDSTFYHTPSVATVSGWERKTPEGFSLAAKVPQIVTHEKVLQNCDKELNQFLATMGLMGAKLGPLLFQFGYFNETVFKNGKDFLARLVPFLKGLPKGYRFALEIRNKQWLTVEFFDLLREHQVAYALIDQAWMPRPSELFEKLDPITTDFTYVRLLGDRKEIERVTKTWRRRLLTRTGEVQEWVKYRRQIVQRGVKVYVYANNHYAGHGPATVRLFQELWSAPP